MLHAQFARSGRRSFHAYVVRGSKSLGFVGFRVITAVTFLAKELFAKHQDVVKRLTDRTSALLRTLLDGLVWRSQRTEANGTLRRVNYFVKPLGGLLVRVEIAVPVAVPAIVSSGVEHSDKRMIRL